MMKTSCKRHKYGFQGTVKLLAQGGEIQGTGESTAGTVLHHF